MNVGDTVVTINSVGKVVGVSTAGNPVVEWPDEAGFLEYLPEQLFVVDTSMPELPEELNPKIQTTSVNQYKEKEEK